ncbi:MAG: response regulator [Patescibacteria group bacterium]|nr:response regulator [Patescibacteria group bacterium]
MNNGIKQEKNISILIVEDDKFLRDLLSRKLKNSGYEVEEAVDGKEALKKSKEKKFEIILLDLVLPGINGFEILEEIKKDSETSNIPVIILSNLGQEEEVEKGLRLGADDYLIKAHFTPDEIINKIKRILNKSKT